MSNASWFGAAVAVPFVAIAAGSMDDYLRQLDTKLPAGERRILIENLIGDAEVLPAAGPDTEISATVHVAGGDEALARQTAEGIRLEADGGHVVVRYPDARQLCALPGRSTSSVDTDTDYLGRRVRVESGTTPGRCVRVDLIVRLPADRELTLKSKVGEIEARDLKANLVLDTGNGGVSVARHAGSLDIDTGSGSVKVDGARGRVKVDTGSGDVDVAGIDGPVNADTGSGHVRINGNHGDVRVDTGSGDVRLQGFADGSDLDIDTGSGDVEVDGDLAPLRRLRVDTGNGNINVVTHTATSLRLVADSGSGRVTIDVAGAQVEQKDPTHAQATLGTGAGRARLDAGSGRIEFHQRTH